MASLGAFGPVAFETSDARILTFQGLQKRRKGRYATFEVINHEQLLQFLTMELATVRFEIRLHHRFCDPKAELKRLDELLQEHEAHMLVIGDEVFGQFVLEEVSEGRERFAPNRVLMHAKAELALREYR